MPKGVYVRTAEMRAGISAGQTLRWAKPEARERQRATMAAIHGTPAAREKLSRAFRHSDDELGYMGAHLRVVRERGGAKEYACVRCERTAGEWALKHDAVGPLHTGRHVKREGAVWSTNVWDYEPLCVPCHRKHDRNGKHAGYGRG